MHGVIAAVPTPVDTNLSPIKAAFLEHCNWALANGCDGLNILGSTGEANSFDADTRKEIMRWAASGLDCSRLMVGTGTPSLVETLRLTVHADDLGYPVALVLPPYYYKPATEEGLYQWYRALHLALGNRPIKVYFYNYPQLTGLAIPVPVIARLRAEFPSRYCGIKDSSGDLDYCRKIAAELPGFAVFPSSETSLGEARSSGFAGCISATANISAPLCARAWNSPDVDDRLLRRIGDIRSRIARHPLIPAIKYLTEKRSGKSDWRVAVPPFTALSSEAKAALDAIEC